MMNCNRLFQSNGAELNDLETVALFRKVEAVRQKDDTGYNRDFLKDGDIIYLSDGEIAVSTQWGLGNIQLFIDGVNSKKDIGIKISAVKE